MNELSRIIKLSGTSRYEAAHGEDTPLVMTLALALLLREQDFDAPLHSAVTDTPSIAEMTFADPLTWGDGVPGSESDTVVRTSSLTSHVEVCSVFRGNAKIAERVGARLRMSLGAIVEQPCPSDFDSLLHELDARAAAHRELSRCVSLNERLLQLKKVD